MDQRGSLILTINWQSNINAVESKEPIVYISKKPNRTINTVTDNYSSAKVVFVQPLKIIYQNMDHWQESI